MDTRHRFARHGRAPIPLRLAAIGLAIVMVLWPHWAPRAAAEQDAGALDPQAARAARIINRLRQDTGLPPLAVHPLLNQAVAHHIEDMITSGQYGHTGSDGSGVHQRVTRTGYEIDGWVGENWATAQDVETAIQWWMGDRPHRQNVLNPNYTEMGLGTRPHPKGWGLILVVDFATGSTNQGPGYPVAATADADEPNGALAVPPRDGLYTVRSGDTLSSIALRHDLDWRQIAAANGLNEYSVLAIGQQLVLPGQEAPTQAPGSAAGNSEEDATSTVSYIVQSGDTLFDIALRYGIGWQDLAAANGLDANAPLPIGTQLRIPATTSTGEPQRSKVHIVQPGETLWQIASVYGVNWYELMRVNGMAEDTVLSIGQKILLP